MDLWVFLQGCLALFDGTLRALLGEPVFRFFLGMLVFGVIVALAALLYRTSKGLAK